mmetsp:Transcript_30811/g.55823  ORF Transcript_30811/g.55823 Transcript_30811/m.55823 type:complete len:81 (+) Transcript_30811:215-457(+)
MILHANLLLVGNGGVGKTSFVKRHVDGTFDAMYVASMGCTETIHVFKTNRGNVQFNVVDMYGQSRKRAWTNASLEKTALS